MADPFSITAGTVGLADVCFRVAQYLRDVQKSAETIDNDISDLIQEVETLLSAEKAVRKAREDHTAEDAKTSRSTNLGDLWYNVNIILAQSRKAIEDLEQLLKDVLGKSKPKHFSKIESLWVSLKKKSKESEYDRLRLRLAHLQSALDVQLNTINLTYNRSSLSHVSEQLEDINNWILSIKQNPSLPDPTDLDRWLDAVRKNSLRGSTNKHFEIPQSVRSIYTGRSDYLQEIKEVLTDSFTQNTSRTQRRFVIYGLGGSGKTQFSCKFAQSCRSSYWGVFWIDASSDVSAKQSFASIAKVAGTDSNERAVHNWLSNLDESWLLIIDSADDPDLEVEKYFPPGERGNILITTRNPALRVHGTVGRKYFYFDSLEDREAEELLLKAVNAPQPWTEEMKKSANLIATALGKLPLALVHAGSAILNGLCTLESYLEYFKSSLQTIRESRRSSGNAVDADSNLKIWSSYELVYQGLKSRHTKNTEYSIELLKMFSFFNNENIRFDMLADIPKTPQLERDTQYSQVTNESSDQGPSKSTTWAKWLKGFSQDVFIYIRRDRRPVLLPQVLRDRAHTKFRVASALKELSQLSLITYKEENKSYSMHPLVHFWVRERPQMSLAEQSLWCGVAASTLSQSILLPPLGNSLADEDLRCDLLPHVDQVTSFLKESSRRLLENRQTASSLSKAFFRSFGSAKYCREDADRDAKFSLVYTQGGRWLDAEHLQLTVREFFTRTFGEGHPSTIGISLALSGTYWNLGRGSDAAKLLERTLEACQTSLGELHPQILRVKDALGTTKLMQGDFVEAAEILDKTVEGMTKVLGSDNPDTYRAILNLTRVLSRSSSKPMPKEMSEYATKGLQTKLGRHHLDSLSAMETCAMIYVSDHQYGNGELPNWVYDQIVEVFEQRSKKLNREHPLTLSSQCNLARIKFIQGQADEAEELIQSGLKIARRNLSEDHVGVLYARLTYGQVLIRLERYEEAENEILAVINSYDRNGAIGHEGQHPNQIAAKLSLCECYKSVGKYEQGIDLCNDVLNYIGMFGDEGPRWDVSVKKRREEFVQLRDKAATE